MFNHVEGYDPISLPTEMIKGKRYYVTPEGNRYPSVTTVTGLLNRVWLNQWKKKVGEKKANTIARKASNRGTRYHQIQEDFINNKLTEEMIKKITPLDLMMFNQTKVVTQGLGDIYMLEGSMYSDELKMAGRVDCIAEYAGDLSVIDFKTSTKAKYPSSIKNYFMQETCYAIMFEEMYGKKIEKIITIIAVEETGQAQLFIEKPSNWIEDVKILREQYRTEYGI